MKRLLILFFLFIVCSLQVDAQQTRSLSDDIRTVQVIVADDPLLPPVARLGTPVEISFDALTHVYARYIVNVQLCNADWSENDEVFESDYISGFNNRPIEEYENSFNTTVLYTHYSYRFPNEDCRLLLSGNYRVRVYEEEFDADEEPVLEAFFSLYVPEMSVRMTVSPNTEIDFNQRHQQVSLDVAYGQRRVVDPQRELHTIVMQNRRLDNAVVNLPPNILKATGAVWTHRRELIFDAGAEFHKFEILDIRLNGMNVDRMEWIDEQHHATLFANTPQHNYTYDPDADGAYVIRHSGDEDNATMSEYLFVHFLLRTPKLEGGDVYVAGLWNNGYPDPECVMHYDERLKAYETAVLLKQGYYNYQFRQIDGDGVGRTLRTDGDFYQTENEYITLVYHRPQGARYDALVGFAKAKSSNQ